ncbi:MAG: CheR family methyltransferase [Spirochaetaceae bacterium]
MAETHAPESTGSGAEDSRSARRHGDDAEDQRFHARRLSEEQFRKLSGYIEGELGIRMPPAKRVMLESRLQKRLRTLSLDSFGDYLDFVFSDSQKDAELLHMIDAVTTNKTDFFRESDHFDYLQQELLPARYADGWGQEGPLRLWSAASSTGEEPYTMAMVLEEFREEHPRFEYGILATDVSTRALDQGRRAIYPEERIEPVPQQLRTKYLLRSKDRTARLVRMRRELRSRVTFYRLNLMHEDYGIHNRFEIIFCRNVIIYFERPTQYRLLTHLYDYLVPGGYLFLGHSETLAGMDVPLRSVAPTIYRKVS